MSDILKDKLNSDNYKTPQCVINKIDETLEKLPEHKSKSKFKYAAVAAGAAIVITVSMGITNPSFAKNIPIINSVFKYLHEKESVGEEYVKFAKGVNKSVTDKGFTVTINEVVCDESSINIAYTVKSEKKFKHNEVPDIIRASVKVDGKDLYAGGGSRGEFIDEYTYAGILNINVGREKIPQNFKFDYNIESIKKVKGNWNFKFYVSKEETDKFTRNFNINYKKELNGQEITIEKVFFTPLNTTLIIKCDKPHKDYGNMMEFDHWYLFDDKGSQIEFKGGGGDGFSYEMHYDKIDEIPKYLTVIPMKIKKEGMSERVIKDLDNVCEMKMCQGRIGNIIIKNVEFLEDKTIVNYSIEGIIPLEQARSLFIMDKDGEEIWSDAIRKIKGNDNNNYTMTFKALDKNKKYKIGTLNFDSVYDIREDLKFNIQIEK